MTIERIDNDGNYESRNVKWATRWEQAHNTRRSVRGPFSFVPRIMSSIQPIGDWRPAPGYAGWYEVSENGEVWSLARNGTRGGPIVVHLNSRGYPVVTLSKYGQVSTVPVGRLVLLAFRGQPSRPGARAKYGPGGKTDCSLANLSWS